MTGHDVDIESRQGPTKVSYWRLLTDQAGVTPEVLERHYDGEGTEASPYLVDFLPKDHWNPMTHKKSYKWLIALTEAIATLAVTFASSAYSGGVQEVINVFDVSLTVAILGVSLYVLGFAIGPLLWAPVSEMFGRQHVLFVTLGCTTVFLAGSAGSQNIETLLILRFFAGSFGSAPLTNAAGVIADIFTAGERGLATSIFALAPFLGPALGE
jgi:predicted MFS family arabinose efflux permease